MTIHRLASLLPCLLLLISHAAYGQNYRILVSNDDGIDSPLLHTLQRVLTAIPDTEIVVSAPAVNQSGSSQSSISDPMRVKRLPTSGGLYGYSVDGRPADAVRFGLLELGREDPFDLVVSGINRGANVGDVSHLSGTVGAAMEAIYQGVPAIAVSQEVQGVDAAASARFVAELISRYKETGGPQGTALSINIPAGELRGVQVMPMGGSYLQFTGFELLEGQADDGLYQRQLSTVQSEDSGSDTYAYQQGYITITPLQFNWTDFDMLDEIRAWNLQPLN